MADNEVSEADKFSANLVHDISNPNNSIMMNTVLLENIFHDAIKLLKDDSGQLRDTMAGIPPDRIEDAVDDLLIGIKQSAKRIQTIADDIKKNSR